MKEGNSVTVDAPADFDGDDNDNTVIIIIIIPLLPPYSKLHNMTRVTRDNAHNCR
jgi:hypothetical protein